MQGLAVRNRIVGVDLVEVSPPYDPSGITSILAAQLLMNMLGFVFHAREQTWTATWQQQPVQV